MSEALIRTGTGLGRAPMTLIDWLSLKLVRSWGLQSRWVDSGLGRLHVLDGPGRGPLPPVVLVHGMGARSTHFRFVIRELLAHHRRIIVPDLLAHGLSDVPGDFHGRDVTRSVEDAILPSLDEPVVLFGNSMGGKAALEFACRHPEAVARLVVAGPAGAFAPDEVLRVWRKRFDAQTHQDGLRLVSQVFGRDFSWPARQVIAWGARKQVNTPTVRLLLEGLSEADCLDPSQLQSLPMPVLLLWGQHERMMDEGHLEWFQTHLPAHTRIQRPPFGHSPFMEAPRVLARIIVEDSRC